MSDTQHSPAAPSGDDSWQARERARMQLAAEALAANKTAVFDALAAAGITAVSVSFDGYGDSGQIESLDAEANGTRIVLPAASITIAKPDAEALTHQDVSLADAIEQIAYDLLEEKHCGWENNDGAYGEFVFDVATRGITLEHNERYTASNTYQHSF